MELERTTEGSDSTHMEKGTQNMVKEPALARSLGIPVSEFLDADYLAPKRMSKMQIQGRFVLTVYGEFMRANTAQMGSEKPTMAIPNPGMLKGLLEQYYYHPHTHIAIEKIAVMNEVRVVDMVCNELETSPSARSVQRAQKMEGTGVDVDFSVPTCEMRQQRSVSYVRDQKYIVVARLCAKRLPKDDKDIPKFNLTKVASIFKRRVALGQNYYHTYLGTKECLADVELCTLEDLVEPSYYDGMTVQFGRMPFMADYRDVEHPVWYQYEPVMVNGVVDCPAESEVMGDAAYASD